MKKLFLPLLFLLFFYITPTFAIDLGRRPDIQAYIQHLSETYNFDQTQLVSWFNQTDFFKPTITKVKKQGKPTPFYVYRNALITPQRVQAGVAYWEEHKETLLAAQKQYGVPVEVLLGILGIETTYGANTGHYSAFQGLVTLAFNHPSRSTYFRSELTNFLLLCREQGWNPLRVQSSFDGGLGLPQFMPSSYREYAVKTVGNEGRPNLFEPEDAILSMANYLRAKGWQANQPIVARAGSANGSRISLQEKHGVEHWLAFHNFSVIKQYNNSTYYAMTVYELGDRVLKTADKKRDA